MTKLEEAIDIAKQREELKKSAQGLQNKAEELKAREKSAFGICDGENVAITDIVQLIYRLMEQ